MRRVACQTIWVATPKNTTKHGESIETYISLREVKNANIQSANNKRDVAEFGERINNGIKIYFSYVPDIKLGDRIYLDKPALTDGDYGIGDYRSISDNVGYGTKMRRNPTMIQAEKITK